MSTPAPAVLNLTLSRTTGFSQDLQLRCDDGAAAVVLGGHAFYAQLWSLDRVIRYVDLEVPITDAGEGRLTLLLSQAVAQGLADTTPITGGEAELDVEATLLEGGEAGTAYAEEGLSGGRAFIGSLPPLVRWDLLMVSADGHRLLLLRGTATLTD